MPWYDQTAQQNVDWVRWIGKNSSDGKRVVRMINFCACVRVTNGDPFQPPAPLQSKIKDARIIDLCFTYGDESWAKSPKAQQIKQDLNTQHTRDKSYFETTAVTARQQNYDLDGAFGEMQSTTQKLNSILDRVWDDFLQKTGGTFSWDQQGQQDKQRQEEKTKLLESVRETRKHQKEKLAKKSHHKGHFALLENSIDGSPVILISKDLKTEIKTDYLKDLRNYADGSLPKISTGRYEKLANNELQIELEVGTAKPSVVKDACDATGVKFTKVSAAGKGTIV